MEDPTIAARVMDAGESLKANAEPLAGGAPRPSES